MALEPVPITAAPRADQYEVGVGRKLFLSLVSSVLGGSAAVGAIVVYARDDASEWWRAIRVMTLIVGLHVGPAWLFAVAPLALIHSADSAVLRPGWATLFGAACGAALLLIALVGFWGLPLDAAAGPLFIAAALCGAVTWESYGFLLRRQSRTSLNPRPSESSP